MHYFEVAPARYTGMSHEAFTYHFPEPLCPGRLVVVPFGKKQLTGVVMSSVSKPKFETKSITQILDMPALPSYQVELAIWMSEYYASSLGQVWQTFLPAGLTTKRRTDKAAAAGFKLPKTEITLLPEQLKVIRDITASPHTSHLLQGITGSGKTRVYIELIRATLKAGKSGIVLIPEIALTPQSVAMFETEFKDQILLTHSALTPAQRHKVWLKALTAESPKVVIGPRSALFMPLPSLGLIVVDESHEPAYKQEQHPRYHASSTAAKLAQLNGAKLVIGSATPSLNDLYLAQAGKLKIHYLTRKVFSDQPAQIEVVDMRHKDLLSASSLISRPLLDALKLALSRGEQSLLFLNRRGTASSLLCNSCGWVALCPRCDLPLTFHADHMRLLCHHCNAHQNPPAICPACGGSELRYVGSGTKRITAEVAKLIPEAKLARIDKDSADPSQLEALYGDLHQGKIDIIIGTQMVAKGWDLPRLSTVGVVSADTMLYVPDFTASERTFSLLHQVAGRAGRRQKSGIVIIQTHTPEHPTIRAAARDDYEQFAQGELKMRKLLAYPPYVYLLKLTCSYKSREAARSASEKMAQQLKGNSQVQVVGPAPGFYEQQAGNFHWQLILKCKNRLPLVLIAREIKAPWTADLDPINIL